MKEEKLIEKYLVVGHFEVSGKKEDITYIDYEKFLNLLWSDKLDL